MAVGGQGRAETCHNSLLHPRISSASSKNLTHQTPLEGVRTFVVQMVSVRWRCQRHRGCGSSSLLHSGTGQKTSKGTHREKEHADAIIRMWEEFTPAVRVYKAQGSSCGTRRGIIVKFHEEKSPQMILDTNIKSAMYIKAHDFLKFLFLGEVFSPCTSKLKTTIQKQRNPTL